MKNIFQASLLNTTGIPASFVLMVWALLHSLHLQKFFAAPQRTLAVYLVNGCRPPRVMLV